ncbi:MAG: hypothetical protein QNJ44_21315 [Rhodobacter sp.]|nr:hypothetical protein [Rhodobacter sp.]
MKTRLHTAGLTLAAGALTLAGTMASADQVFNDDVIITFSACIGNDCVNGESFGFDTLRLKENNLRIKFQDTSTSASFPSNDWQITANESDNGGENRFSVDDITGGRTPFTIRAGAPNHSLYVDAQGDVGINKKDAVVELHIVDGDSPTIRLEQDGSSGFTPQTWDLAGNEANFFVRDVTNGSQLPFKIKPGADSNSLFIAANNDVGIGTDSPTEDLHVKNASEPSLRVEDTGGSVVQIDSEAGGDTVPRVLFSNTTAGTEWEIAASDSDTFRISRIGTGVGEFRVDATGGVFISGLVNCTSLSTNASGKLICN